MCNGCKTYISDNGHHMFNKHHLLSPRHILGEVRSKALPKKFRTKKSLLIKIRKTQPNTKKRTERKTKFRRGNIWVAESRGHISLGPEMKWNRLPWSNILRNQLTTSWPKEVLSQSHLQMRMGVWGPNWMERNAMDEQRVRKTSHLSVQHNHSIKRSRCANQQSSSKMLCLAAIGLSLTFI